MSFILDALKKSELERQRQSVPGLMDAPSRARRNRLPVWAAAIAALLAINLLVLSVVLLRRSAPDEHAQHAARSAAAPAAAADSADRAAPGKPFSPMDQAPVYAPEIPVPADDAPPAVQSSAARTQASRLAGPTVLSTPSARRQDPVLTEAAAAENQEVLPTINELNLTGAQALPELHLDVHVYATRPADRFVYLNMRKYHEGAVLQEGPTLERIRRDGVVLNYQGMRFLLPRQ